jgi:UTP:GlnB (protein PII) uridylyltransferase
MSTIPTGTPLPGPRTADPGGPGALRAALAARLATARDVYAVEARHGKAGRAVLAHYADQIDGVVRDLATEVLRDVKTPLVIGAVGGYGRRSLCLNSDLDLLIVAGGPIGADEERAIGALLQPLWDLRLTIGQHVREIADFDQVETDNPELLIALFDLRPIAGDAALFADLTRRIEARAGERGRCAPTWWLARTGAFRTAPRRPRTSSSACAPSCTCPRAATPTC